MCRVIVSLTKYVVDELQVNPVPAAPDCGKVTILEALRINSAAEAVPNER